MPQSLGTLIVPLLDAQTVDETASTPLNLTGYAAATIYVSGAGTITSGVVTIEEAYIPARTEAAGYTGTWSSITTVTASDVSGGAQQAVHLPLGAYNFVRTRISTAIGGGGSISTALVAVA